MPVESIDNIKTDENYSAPLLLCINKDNADFNDLCGYLQQQSVNLHKVFFSDKKNIIAEMEDMQPQIICLEMDSEKNNEALNLCDQIKKKKSYRDIPIILFSNNDSRELIEIAYQHGCAEIIFSPIDPGRVYQRIKTHQNQQEISEKLKLKIKEAKEIAFTAMQDSSELGKVIHFFEKISECNNYEELTREIFNLFKEMSLRSSVMIHAIGGVGESLYFSDDNQIHPIELKLLQQFREIMYENPQSSRFFTFNHRILASSSNVTLLIRNCPEDALQQGRIRDILGALINGLDQRCAGIKTEQIKLAKNKMVKEIIQETESNIRALNSMSEEHGRKTIAIMDALSERFGSGLSILGLTEQQEEFFINMLDNAMKDLVALQSDEIQIENNFNKTLIMLNRLVDEL